METLIERSRKTVDDLVARRYEPRTYEEKVQHALDVVSMHLQEENPDRIDECVRLYTEDAVWEVQSATTRREPLSRVLQPSCRRNSKKPPSMIERARWRLDAMPLTFKSSILMVLKVFHRPDLCHGDRRSSPAA